MRVLLETFEMRVSNFRACMCSAIVIVCACAGRVLYVMSSGGFSLNETRWEISARVLVLQLPVLLMAIGMICTRSRPFYVILWLV